VYTELIEKLANAFPTWWGNLGNGAVSLKWGLKPGNKAGLRKHWK